ncbi:smad fha domain-containing protein [Lichtheimia corymbifera JMRC:FSU:9682]|uniref:Smad fha domain-containing protein n=1 Tax=Lichtheimia corymbifera JMRC:FSU:9682 TaxID=1263082 RepID=A0A068RPU6_9FUNG|nr:smad fha domain-containing protein [Lichtheimia corymbifera JMRC:FSU:9682]
MTSQYADHTPPTENTATSSPSSSTFRRSLNLSQGASALLGRRFSRTSTQQPTSPRTDTTSTSMSPAASSSSSSTNNVSVHVRIVPSIENPRRSLIFDVVDREIKAGTVVKIGRFTDRSVTANHISFKSKVVSRTHCEIWVDLDGKLYLRDTKSSSGTFVNHVRLSTANQESRPTQVHDGDIVQLGVDYQGGLEEMYRAVKMRFELNRTPPQQANGAYSMSAFNNLRSIMANSSGIAAESGIAAASQQLVANNKSSSCEAHQEHDTDNIEECCICLYALAPLQALFVAPCSHSYHFKCIRPLLESYPGFQCPICRTYSDLEASVAVEAEEVMEKYGLKPKTNQVAAAAASDDEGQQQTPALPAASSAQDCVRSMSQMTTSMDDDQPAAQSPPDSHHDVQPTTTPYNPDIQSSSGDHYPLAIISSNQTSQDIQDEEHHDEDEEEEVLEEQDDGAASPVERRSTFVFDEHAQHTHQHGNNADQPSNNTTNNTTGNNTRRYSERRLSANNLVDKLKMAFSSEKRKSAHIPTSHHSNNNNNSAALRKQRQRASAIIPISYSNFWRRDDSDEDNSEEDFTSLDDRPHLQHPTMTTDAGSSSSSHASPSSSPPQRTSLLTRTLSAHSNNGAPPLADIVEETQHPSAVRVD